MLAEHLAQDIVQLIQQLSCENEADTTNLASVCQQCGGHMELTNLSMCCDTCGLNRQCDYSESSAISCIGNYAQDIAYTRVGSTSDLKHKATYNDIMMKFSTQTIIPEIVFLQTIDIINTIQANNIIYRNSNRRGLIAALVYCLCTANYVTQKPSTISKMWDTKSKSLSNGQKIIKRLVSLGIIDDPLPVDYRDYNMESILRRISAIIDRADDELSTRPTCMLLSDILDFIRMHVKFTNKYHLAMSSVTTSKCAGVLFILFNNVANFPINMEAIEHCCSCVRTTAKRYADAVSEWLIMPAIDANGVYYKNLGIAQRRLRHLYKKYNVSLNKRVVKSK